MSDNKAKIYALLEPGGSLENIKSIRYIGYTIGSLRQRLSGHMSQGKTRKGRLQQWIDSLESRPEIVLIEDGMENPKYREGYWMDYYKKKGSPLLNTNFVLGIWDEWDRLSTRQKKALLARRQQGDSSPEIESIIPAHLSPEDLILP
jgi:hypothetical protein